MRYVPLGYDTSGEMKLLAYLIAWFHNLLSLFYKDIAVTYSAILFPVVMFALTTIAFFLFSRKIFYKENTKTRNIIALLATAFFVVIPSLLPRTIAGIPEKESAAFFFMFMAFYLFLEAFTSEKSTKRIMFGIFSGISTALMALVWGGVLFVFFAIPLSVLLAFIFGEVKKEKFFVYSIWLISSFLIMMPFSTRYHLKNLIVSTSTGSAIGVLFIIGAGLLIIKDKRLEKVIDKTKVSKEIFSIIITVSILLITVIVVFGPNYILHIVSDIKSSLITPMTTRFGLTVAENKQPYFINDWKNEFGPVFHNIPLFFWLFFFGSVVLFNNLIKKLEKKMRFMLTFSYTIFLICLIFSRYSSNSSLNGTSGLSLFVYFGGWLFFLGTFAYAYYKTYNKEISSTFSGINFSYILYFIILTLGITGARGGIRLIMVLGAISPIAASFLVVKTSQKYIKEKNEMLKLSVGILALIIIFASIFTLWSYYNQVKSSAEVFVPGPYQWQWQNAMSWVRENTSQNSVFAHWWDYGYWLQSIGERATIVDGGNSIGYWNHLVGRYVLTGTDEKKALEFLYTHNVTHLLIDSTDIGKYTAFSSIGSDENYDRFSWITTFSMDERQTQEVKNETIYVYPGGIATDEDIVWEENNTRIFLPKKSTGVGAILLGKDKDGNLFQPEAIFVYNNQQFKIPLRYIYFKNLLKDFGSGLDAGVFLFPKLDPTAGGQIKINEIGAMMYLSKRTIHSQLANLYLFDQKSDYFKISHIESDFVINNLRQQGMEIGEFVNYQGFRGPIKIWEVSYPKDIEINLEYLRTDYPNEEIYKVKEGEYN